ncbi:MAG: hypothetical protein CVT92_00515 [Bacteroidetes bacterium HGW-Bacteroidetes-1]|jgi:hypothetical protein|nr:MAG: hypothetical protein CVT92_00515 [Bacteroidetes bacterium HGW-Bacteroidetes-1]
MLFLVQLGTSWVFYVQKQSVRKEVKKKYLEGFVSDELMFLEIPHFLELEPNPVFKRIHSREFVYMGQMYDILEQEIIGDVTWYLVYPDHKETQLKKRIEKLMTDFDNQSEQQPSEYLSSLSLLFCEPIGEDNNDFLYQDTSENNFLYFFSIKEWCQAKWEHPPCSVG